jgi:hypothetical protein
MLQASDKLLAAIADRVARTTLACADEIGKAVGKVIDKYKMGKHFHTTITDTTLTYRHDQPRIDAEAQLDGIYVLRTSVDATPSTPPRWCTATRTWATSNTTFPSSRPTTWTGDPSTIASRTASKPTC